MQWNCSYQFAQRTCQFEWSWSSCSLNLRFQICLSVQPFWFFNLTMVQLRKHDTLLCHLSCRSKGIYAGNLSWWFSVNAMLFSFSIPSERFPGACLLWRRVKNLMKTYHYMRWSWCMCSSILAIMDKAYCFLLVPWAWGLYIISSWEGEWSLFDTTVLEMSYSLWCKAY